MSSTETPPTPQPLRPIAFAASSQIASIEYDESTLDLIVSFQRGGIYKYANVPMNIADGFTQAPSAGRYLNQMIKEMYDYEKIG